MRHLTEIVMFGPRLSVDVSLFVSVGGLAVVESMGYAVGDAGTGIAWDIVKRELARDRKGFSMKSLGWLCSMAFAALSLASLIVMQSMPVAALLLIPAVLMAILAEIQS